MMNLETLSRDELLQLARAARELELREEKARLEASLIEFYRAAWETIDPAPYVDGWHLHAIAEHLEAVSNGQIRKLLITMPPRHSKTLLASVVWPAWLWAREKVEGKPLIGPQVKFLTLAYGDDLALDSALLMRRLVESDWYQARWGSRVKLRADQEAKSKFDNSAGGTRISAGFGGTLTGRGGDIRICFPADEPVLTKSGWKPIGQLVAARSKEQVRSLDFATGKECWTDVVGWHTNPGADIYEVVLSDGSSVRCTGDHNILTLNRGWVRADGLDEADRLPMVDAFTNVRDVLAVETQAFCNCSNRFLGVQNFANLLWRRFVLGANALVMRQANAIGNVGPCFATANLTDNSGINSIFRRNDFGLVGARGNSGGLSFGQNGSGAARSDWKRSVTLGVGNVFRLGSVGKVVDAIVARITVQMANFMSGWTRTYEGGRDGDVNVNRAQTTVLAATDAKVATSVLKKFEFFFRQWKRSSIFAHYNARQTSGATKTGNFISGVPNYRTPLLVRKVGFAHQTFCLTVSGDSNFIAGKGRGLVVSNCDDPLKADDAESEVKRQAVIRRYDGTLKSRMTDPRHTAEVVIQQRLHENDLAGHILDTDSEFEHLMLPALFEPERRYYTSIGWTDPRTTEGEILWPERFDEKSLATFKRNAYEWAGQWQQRPEVRGGSIIKRDWWQPYETDDGRVPQCSYVVASLDPAYTAKEENDPSALVVVGVYEENGVNKLITLNAWRKRLELHGPHIDRLPGETEAEFVKRTQKTWGLCEWVAYTCRRFRVDRLLVESKASGLSVAQEIRRLHSHEGWGVQLVDPKGQDKVARVYAVQHLFAEGMVYIPTFTDGTLREWGQMLVDEMAAFPKGVHDDLTDAMSQALRHIRDVGLAVRRDERASLLEEMRRYKPQSTPLYPT